MAKLRLIEIALPRDEARRVVEAMDALPPVKVWCSQTEENDSVVSMVVRADQADDVFERIGELGLDEARYRALLVAIDGTLPEIREQEDEGRENGSKPKPIERDRVSREELLDSLADGTRLSLVQMAMVVLSTIVAAIGLTRDDVAIIIGAMVIAPLLTPNMALALATTLGDLTMARKSLLTHAAGVAAALALAVAIGAVYPVDPTTTQIENRTVVSLGDVVLALSAGTAGALSVTTGVPAALVGVMVAVALLPPLVACGLLLGTGELGQAAGAALLLATNVICVNLAGVVTFAIQGIRPRRWHENDKARRATWIAVAWWTTMLAALVGVILLSQRS